MPSGGPEVSRLSLTKPLQSSSRPTSPTYLKVGNFLHPRHAWALLLLNYLGESFAPQAPGRVVDEQVCIQKRDHAPSASECTAKQPLTATVPATMRPQRALYAGRMSRARWLISSYATGARLESDSWNQSRRRTCQAISASRQGTGMTGMQSMLTGSLLLSSRREDQQ